MVTEIIRDGKYQICYTCTGEDGKEAQSAFRVLPEMADLIMRAPAMLAALEEIQAKAEEWYVLKSGNKEALAAFYLGQALGVATKALRAPT